MGHAATELLSPEAIIVLILKRTHKISVDRLRINQIMRKTKELIILQQNVKNIFSKDGHFLPYEI